MYSILIYIVWFFIRVASLWNPKLKLFADGRKDCIRRIEDAVRGYDDIIWFHCASMGEFEEARPVMEATRERYPDRKILLTFFSPSGYEVRKNWPVVDWVFYLPMDTFSNARRFVNAVRPSKAVFTIGEFWFNYLSQLRKNGIDTYIMSVRAVKASPYLKWYGGIYRKLLRDSYKAIMVKDGKTLELLHRSGCRNAVRTGDARFDRVLSIASEEWSNPVVDCWSCGRKVFVAGSTHQKDDDVVIPLINAFPDAKVLVVPHELDMVPIRRIQSSVVNKTVVYSEVEDDFISSDASIAESAEKSLKEAQVLIINKIGMLSKLYRYGEAAFVGGGFTTLPHSVIEAAVYGMPVSMGPLYDKNLQFVELMALGAATPASMGQELADWYKGLKADPERLSELSRTAYEYCQDNGGATERIMAIIFS